MFILKRFPLVSIICLFICFFVSCSMSYSVKDTVFDSDASGELMLAKHLSDNNRIISDEWYYSTEIRVINTQIIYSLIFKLTDDWGMVRFVSSIIFRLLILASYFYFMIQTGIGIKNIIYSACLLLIPFSTTYARIILLHGYYVPHITFGFFILGLFLHFFRSEERFKKTILFFLVLFVAFLGGLGGVRYLMTIYVPLVVVCVFGFLSYHKFLKAYQLNDFNRENIKKVILKNETKAVAVSVCILISAVLGCLYNIKILSANYYFTDYSSTTIEMITTDIINNIISNIFEAIGFYDGTKLLSFTGIISILMISVLVFFIYKSIMFLKQNKNLCDKTKIIPLFFLASFAVNIAVIIITQISFALYYLPVIVYFFPLIALILEDFNVNNNFRNKFFAAVVILIMIANSYISINYIMVRQEESTVTYGGLVFKDINRVKELSNAVGFVYTKGYQVGFSSFWNANIITEMTDGKIEMVPIELNDEEELDLYRWLTFRKYDEKSYYEDKKLFWIFTTYELETIYPLVELNFNIECIYEDENFIICDINPKFS